MHDRVVEAFEQGFFERLRPHHMPGNSCMCCGRTLTDPISQARFTGPECFGSSSTNIPWLTDLTEAAAA